MNVVARGFSRLDAVAVVAVAGVLTVCAVPALSEVRFDAMRQVCVSNLMRYHGYSSQYAWDTGGQFSAQEWYAGMRNPIVGGDLGFNGSFGTDLEAQQSETTAQMRQLSGIGSDLLPKPSPNWFPQYAYSHLPMLSLLGLRPLDSFLVCPADGLRERMRENADELRAAGQTPNLTSFHEVFSSSYRPDIYTWSSSQQRLMVLNGIVHKTGIVSGMSASGSLQFFNTDPQGTIQAIPGSFGPRPTNDVRFPSQKVILSDDYARHHGRTRYYAYAESQQDLLFHDGSVRHYRTDYTNPGWDPKSRTSMRQRLNFSKAVDPFGTLDTPGTAASFRAGWYRWTRGGLMGWDVPRSPNTAGKAPSNSVLEAELNTTGSEWSTTGP